MGETAVDARILADKVFDSSRRGEDIVALSIEANNLLLGRDFRPGTELRNAFDQELIDNNLVNDLILVESDRIDGAIDGKNDGMIQHEEVQHLLELGNNDIYLQTALEYLSPRTTPLEINGEIVRNDISISGLQSGVISSVSHRPSDVPESERIIHEGSSEAPDLYQMTGPTDWNPAPEPMPFPSFRQEGTGEGSAFPYPQPLPQFRLDELAAAGTNITPGTFDPLTNTYTHLDGTIENVNPMAAEGTTEGNLAAAQNAETLLETDYKSVLQSPTATTIDQLKAIKGLVNSGETTATIVDQDGNTINVRMEILPVSGDRSLVQMFAVDPNTGKETVILRAVNDGGDNFRKQTDANGNEVDFVGTRWKRDHAGSIFAD